MVQILTFKLLLLFNVFGFGLVCVLSLFLTQGHKRVQVLGWICMIFSICVFVAPLFIAVGDFEHAKHKFLANLDLFLILHWISQRKVIKTKSVEFMPFSLSFFLTLSALMWFFYGYLKKDQFVAVSDQIFIHTWNMKLTFHLMILFLHCFSFPSTDSKHTGLYPRSSPDATLYDL